jgi:hypothetical protein
VKENNILTGGQIKDIGRGSRDETQRGYTWGYMMQINMIERTLTPGGEEQVAYLVFCKYASSVPRSEWERCVVLQELFLSWLYRTENKGVSCMGKTGLAVL